MKSFEMLHVSEIEYNGGRMLGCAGWGAAVCEDARQASEALQSMSNGAVRHPADWPGIPCAGPLESVYEEDLYASDWKVNGQRESSAFQ